MVMLDWLLIQQCKHDHLTLQTSRVCIYSAMHIHFVLFWVTFALTDTPSGVYRIVLHRVWRLLQMYAVSPCFIKMYEYKFYLKQSVFFSPSSQYKHCESLALSCLPACPVTLVCVKDSPIILHIRLIADDRIEIIQNVSSGSHYFVTMTVIWWLAASQKNLQITIAELL